MVDLAGQQDVLALVHHLRHPVDVRRQDGHRLEVDVRLQVDLGDLQHLRVGPGRDGERGGDAVG